MDTLYIIVGIVTNVIGNQNVPSLRNAMIIKLHFKAIKCFFLPSKLFHKLKNAPTYVFINDDSLFYKNTNRIKRLSNISF